MSASLLHRLFLFQEKTKMQEIKEPCRFYSLLMPIKQQDALRAYSHKNRVPVSVCVRSAIDLFLKNVKSEKPAKSGE